MTWRCGAASACLWVVVSACSTDTSVQPVSPSDTEVTTPSDAPSRVQYKRGTRLDDALSPQPNPAAEVPAPTELPMQRGCLKQDDCPDGLACVAVTLRDLRCMAYEPAPPRTGPRGRPVPPVGLLDGDAMRAQMGVKP